MLDIVKKCLERQTLSAFEWIIVGNEEVEKDIWLLLDDDRFNFFEEPPKKEGDYYSLNKAWNTAFKQAKGELIISIVDGIWFPPDILEKLWDHYINNQKACVSCIGHQYDRIENRKPEHLVWRDPRSRDDLGSFYEVTHREMELCIASFPKKAVIEVGGVDEEFDKYAALSEKEMMARMYKAGYKTYIDQSIEYRAIHHERLTKDWDEKYKAGWDYFDQCLKKIESGKRLRLDFLI